MDRHAISILNQISGYDGFLSSLSTVADMGCGTGEDITWWATLENSDDPPKPYNFKCYAVDNDLAKLNQVPDLPNIQKINKNFICL